MRPFVRLSLGAGSWFVCFLLLLGHLTQAQAAPQVESLSATQPQNVAFIPLRVNAATNSDNLTRQIDDAVAATLATRNMLQVPREQVKALLAAQAPWPPPPASLREIAARGNHDYVALGSCTVLGQQVSIDIQIIDLLTTSPPQAVYRSGDLPTIAGALREAIAEVLAQTGREQVIASIAPAGNSRIDSGSIQRKITSKPGDFYNPATLRQDLRSIFSMGYFDDVQIEVVDSAKGKAVTFRVKEKPLISRVVFSGTSELQEEDIREAANLKANTILNPKQLHDASQRIRDHYKAKGFYNTKVTPEMTPQGTDQLELRFIIEEGPKVYVKDILFSGNTTFKGKELNDVIETNTKGLFSFITDSGLLKMEILRQDADRIATFYNNHGFIDAKVGEPVVEQREGWLYITFQVQEGPRYRVGTVDITGDLLRDKEELLNQLKIRKEEFLSRKILREDILQLTDLYAEHGYAFAEARPRVDKNDQSKRVDITIQMDKGSLVYFNRVEIRGNSRTRDNVIRRDLAVEEGGIFNSKALRKSNENLHRLNYFEEVSVTPEPAMNENLMNVVVNVKEKPTGQFSVGAGYSTADNLLFMGEIAENNLFGRGDRLSLQANMGSTTTRFNLGYTDPRFRDTELLVGFDLFDWRREYDDYTKDSTGGVLRFGHPLWERWRLHWSYGYTDTTLSDVAEDASWIIRQSMDIHVTSAVGVALIRDTLNHPFNPTKGSNNRLSVKYAGDPLGGDAQFTKLEASSSWYFPLGWVDNTIHLRGNIGQAFENEDGKFPVYEHYYLGGLNSIRGFKFAHVSPKDPDTGERIGGDKMWYANLEYIFPLIKNAGLRGVIFTDVGNVYAEEDDWDFGEMKKTAGLGIRWLSPMGPLRLEWGYNLDRQEDEESSVWDFSIGGVF